MKKLSMIGLVVVLLAVSAVPALAAHPNNGRGNANGNANRDQTQVQEKVKLNNRNRNQVNNPGLMRNSTGQNMRMPFYLQGTITAISGDTITVKLIHGNSKVKQFIGTDLVITTSEMTQFYKINQGQESQGETESSPTDNDGSGSRVAITFGQLAVNDVVAIHGNVVLGTDSSVTYNARLVTVYTNMVFGLSPTDEP